MQRRESSRDRQKYLIQSTLSAQRSAFFLLPTLMKPSSFLVVTLFVPLALGETASSVHTDAHAVTCQSYSISWSGGTPPFKLVLQDAAAPDPPLVSRNQTDDSFVWTPNVPAGTTILLHVGDSAGTLGQTSQFVVQKGTDTSCVLPPNSTVATRQFSSPLPTQSPSDSAFSSRASSGTSSGVSPSSSGQVSSAIGGSSNTTKNNSLAIAAIVVPVCVLVIAALVFLVVRLRRRRKQDENPFTGKGGTMDAV
ncbi:hypothetical protein C8F01DRAFT_1105247 [Mycena amicta]|nr:hypothetical protein C8F01DRAFT_1105247 [Mycena amicta]